jgi:hypothetical protein
VPPLSVPEVPLSARRLGSAVELSEAEPVDDVVSVDVEPELLVSLRPMPILEHALTDTSTTAMARGVK